MIDILLLIVGLVLILTGANYLTDGSVAIAKRFQVSEFVVGLTIVAVGTSMPEMVVSFISAMHGNGDMAAGGIVGSNIFNTFGIIGTCALIRPMDVTKDNIRKDIPMGVLASVLLVIVSLSGVISRLEGWVLLLLYFSMIYFTIRGARKNSLSAPKSEPINILMTILCVVGGFAALIGGGELFLRGAVSIATKLNIPQSVIAVTLVACGTSLPEFAASLVSLLKGRSEIALGNVIGSNVANILLVLGASSAVVPISMEGIGMLDMLVALAGMLILFVAPLIPPKMRLGRAEASVLLIGFGIYLYYVISNA